MNFLVIDDERTFTNVGLGFVADAPHNVNDEHVTYARTSHDGLGLLAKHFVDYKIKYASAIYLFLDHDLGGDDDIRPVVDFLTVAKVPGIREIFIHSQNPASGDLVKVLSSAGYLVSKITLDNLNL